MNFNFWWPCFWWGDSDELASDDVITSGALIFQMHFSSDASGFLFVDSFALFCSSRTLQRYKKIVYGPVHLNKY